MPMLMSAGNCPSPSGRNTSALSLAPSRIGMSTSFSTFILYWGSEALASLGVATCSCTVPPNGLPSAPNAIRAQHLRLRRSPRAAHHAEPQTLHGLGNNRWRAWTRSHVDSPANYAGISTESAMKAAVATEHGLALRDIPQPQPKPNEVLVKVRAAALNRADLATARGIPHGSHGGIGAPVGLEWAGEVVEAGAEVEGYKPGDRVMCSGTGGYAEYAVTDWGRVNPMPNGMSFEQAATLPVALITLHNALVTAGRLRAGENVMIQGASSGVGLMGLQIARLMGAKLVIGSSTNDARRARLKEFGADLAVDTRDAAWVDAVLAATVGKGVDLVIDMLSGPVVVQSMKATAILGRIVNVGRLAGMKAEFDFDLHALRRIDYIGVTFRTRTLEEVREISRRMRADLWDAVTAGKLKLPIDRRFPLDEAVAAQAHMRENKHLGKIVLTM